LPHQRETQRCLCHNTISQQPQITSYDFYVCSIKDSNFLPHRFIVVLKFMNPRNPFLLCEAPPSEVDFQRQLLWFKNRRRWWKWVKLKWWFINGVWNGFEKMSCSECWITVTSRWKHQIFSHLHHGMFHWFLLHHVYSFFKKHTFLLRNCDGFENILHTLL